MSKKITRLLYALSITMLVFGSFAAAQGRRSPQAPIKLPQIPGTTQTPAGRGEGRPDTQPAKVNSGAASREITIDALGLKVQDSDFAADETEHQRRIREEDCQRYQPKSKNGQTTQCAQPIRLPRVTAVLENGPAYMAGVTPGDIIGYRTATWVNSEHFASNVAHQMRQDANRGIFFSLFSNIGGTLVSLPRGLTLRPVSAPAGNWVTTMVTHTESERTLLPGVAAARLAMKEKQEKLLANTKEMVDKDPCGISRTVLSTIETEAGKMAVMADPSDSHRYLGIVEGAAQACENVQKGEISNLEAAINLITQWGRKLDPCTYSPSSDYRQGITTWSRYNFLSKADYDKRAVRSISAYLEAAPPQQKQCFIGILKTSLTAKR